MDFTFSPEADDAAGLAAEILAGSTGPARQQEVDASGERFDADLWQALVDAGLVSLALPEEAGGAGLGLVEQCRVLVEVGRRVAAVPAATHAAATIFLARVAPDLLTDGLHGVAVSEPLGALPATPAVVASADGLSGSKVLVRAATHAEAFVVTAVDADGPATFLVRADEVTVRQQHTSDGDVAGILTFDATPAQRIGGAETVTLLHDLLTVTSCAELLGVSTGALALTASYATTREQFGRPIGIFQGVRHRLADGHIDTLAHELTLWQAIWRVDEGLESTAEVATAKLWAADAAHRIAHTTVHVHGGVGIDLDGEAHRYFTAAKRWELTGGGATEQALVIGRVLAD
jgi:alkylation response protein AidB-like acyl-CoA dehydrogenase